MLDEIEFVQGLSTSEYEFVRAHHEIVTLPVGQINDYDENGQSQKIVFPIDAVCSANKKIHGENTSEVAMIFGAGLMAGDLVGGHNARETGLTASTIISGRAVAIDRTAFTELHSQSVRVQMKILRYAVIYVNEMASAFCCSANHSSFKRVADLLAKIDTLVGGGDLPICVSQLAKWSGYSRGNTQVVVAELKLSGAITMGVRSFRVKDRAQLNGVACGCSRRMIEHNAQQLSLLIVQPPPPRGVVKLR